MVRLFLLLVLVKAISADLLDLDLSVDLDLGGGGGGEGGGGGGGGGECINVKGEGRFLDRSLPEMYVEQPFFVTFLSKDGDNALVDNICYTFFALPDNPVTYQLYISRVYCDGSTAITSYVITQCELGVFKAASPYCTFTDTTFAYGGCDTYVNYRCLMHGDCLRDCDGGPGTVFGLSTLCRPMGLSCLKKLEEVIKDHGIPEEDYYLLPMKLPNKCVTSQICINEPPIKEFKKAVGLPRDRPRDRPRRRL